MLSCEAARLPVVGTEEGTLGRAPPATGSLIIPSFPVPDGNLNLRLGCPDKLAEDLKQPSAFFGLPFLVGNLRIWVLFFRLS